MNPTVLLSLSCGLIMAGAFIGAYSREKYSIIVGANLISVGILGVFISAAFFC